MDILLYRFLSFSNIVSFGIYSKNTAATILAVTITYNLIILSNNLGLPLFKGIGALPELLMLVSLVFWFRFYYSKNAERLTRKFGNETSKSKWTGFFLIFSYLALTFILVIS